MGKVLLWVLVVIVALFFMRIVASRAASRDAAPRSRQDKQPEPPTAKFRWGAGRRAAGSPGVNDQSDGRGQPRPPSGRAPDPTLGAVEPMVRCAHCGIHLPRSEALMKNGQTWCSDAHAQLGVRQI